MHALHAESADSYGFLCKMLQESCVGIQWWDDIIFEKEDPWCIAEWREGIVDEGAGRGDFAFHGSARKICETLNSNGEYPVRLLSVIAFFQPLRDLIPELRIL